MMTAFTYRGVRLHRLMLGGRWSEGWVTPDGQVRGWNAVLAYVDDVCEGEPILGTDHPAALPPHYCVDCGVRDLLDLDESIRTALLATRLCFWCLIWHQRVRDMQRFPWKYFVANGVFYTVGDRTNAPNHCRGFGGATWVVEWPNGHVERTDNLWHGGEVPEHWRERLPDNATLTRVGQ